jgi:hypothetical protein
LINFELGLSQSQEQKKTQVQKLNVLMKDIEEELGIGTRNPSISLSSNTLRTIRTPDNSNRKQSPMFRQSAMNNRATKIMTTEP